MAPGKIGVANYDLESGYNPTAGQLYPNMMENPTFRWAFIRKVYSIVAVQLLFTFGVSTAMFIIPEVRQFLLHSKAGLYTIIGGMIVTLILGILMVFLSNRHPWNIILLLLFTIGMAFMVGSVCMTKNGKAVLLAAAVTGVLIVSLTLYTFWAAKEGYDFNFLGPFLLCALLILITFGLIRMFLPLGTLLEQSLGCIGALVFSGFIIYDTDNLIKRHTYDEYITASINLYLDSVNLFLYIVTIVDSCGD